VPCPADARTHVAALLLRDVAVGLGHLRVRVQPIGRVIGRGGLPADIAWRRSTAGSNRWSDSRR
jgi:hypothetical protein